MKLLLSCTELGLGHVTRLIPIGKKLAERKVEVLRRSTRKMQDATIGDIVPCMKQLLRSAE